MIGTLESADVRTTPLARRLLTILAVTFAGFFAVFQLSQWPTRLRYPGEQDFVEASPLAEMLHLRQGIRIYDPPSPDRFGAANYGPLYYLLGAKQSEEGR
jgi:hypothetical protein